MKKLFALILICSMALVSCQEESQSEDTTAMITKVKLSKTSLSFWVGDDYTMLTTTTTPTDVDIESTIWSVSNDVPEGCVTVDSYGRVTPVTEGEATVSVTVTATDGSSASADCQVTVGLVNVTGVTITKDTLNLFKYETETLKTTIAPVNASDYSVSWSIKEDPSGCITLNTKGKVTAVTSGTAIVQATSDTNPDVVGECVVIVTVLPETITLSESTYKINIESYGEEGSNMHQFTYVMTPDDVSDDSVVWSIEDENEADRFSLDQEGNVVSLEEGNGVVVVTSVSNPDVYARCFLEVVIPLTSISFSPETLELEIGDTYELAVGLTPAGTSEKDFTWTVEGTDTDCITYDATAITYATITAVSEGTITLVATSNVYPDIVAKCVITVTSPTTID